LYPPISDDDGSWTPNIAVDGATVRIEPSPYVYVNPVSPDYFRTLGIRVQKGRDFSDRDSDSSTRAVIINESLARRFFPGRDPLGHHLSVGRDKRRQDLEIIAVVSDAKYQLLQEPARAIAYLPHLQNGPSTLFVEIRGGGPIGSIAESVRREIRALDRAVPVRVESVNDRIRTSLVKERVIAILATVLSSSALVLACAGLYGLLAYAVSRQMNELGVRLALGATRTGVLWIVLRQTLVMAVIGIMAGLVASVALGRFARTMVFEIGTSDPLALGTAAGVMLVVALGAGLVPAHRATRIDPVVALRWE
jgi:predicted permease